MGKRSSGFLYFWIFVYQQNIWNEKYIFEWYIFFFNLFHRWENVRLDFYIFEYLFINKIFEMKNISLNDIYFFVTYFIDGKTFVWISLILDDTFFLAYFIEGKIVRSVVYEWLQSHIWGGSDHCACLTGSDQQSRDRKWRDFSPYFLFYLDLLIEHLAETSFIFYI